VARFALSLNIAISVPYYCFMPRISAYALLSLVLPKVDLDVFHVLSTTVIFISAFLATLFITNLGTFSELVGVAAICLGLILPPMIFIALEKGKWYSPAKLVHWCILVVGVLSGIGVMLTILLDNWLGFNF